MKLGIRKSARDICRSDYILEAGFVRFQCEVGSSILIEGVKGRCNDKRVFLMGQTS